VTDPGITTTDPRPTEAAAGALDAADPLAGYRSRFALPRRPDGAPATYLAGQSLGAQPLAARAAVEAELDAWATLGVEGWFEPERPWLEADKRARDATARLVGARPDEVATMNTLTVNLHLLLLAFYRPAGRRTAILIDAPTFPSDLSAVESQLRHHGLDPAEHLVVVGPRTGEDVLRSEDLEAAIHDQRDRLAVALLAGVNYATGQRQDVARLTGVVHEAGGIAIWDLAHAVGNVPLALHDDRVDAATWCTYKYLNSGPGAIGQLFVHERHAQAGDLDPLTGWWGNREATRFRMAETFDPAPGAAGWRISTPPVLSLAPIAASLAIFDEVGLPALRAKSIRLTGFLEACLDALVPDATILTPRAPEDRGAQLSVRVSQASARLRRLEAAGVIADFREPDIIRLAPVPLYNGFRDAWLAAEALAATADTA
jgi:kynureninase